LLDDELYAQEIGGGPRDAPPPVPLEIGAWLHIGESDVVTVYTGKVEVGQNARTSLTQAVMEETRRATRVGQDVMGDTDLTPFDMGTFRQPDHAADVAAESGARRRRRARCCSIWRRGSGAWTVPRSPSPRAGVCARPLGEFRRVDARREVDAHHSRHRAG